MTLLKKPIVLSRLHLYSDTFEKSDLPIFEEYISHGAVKKIKIVDCKNIDLLIPILLGPSSLETVHLSGTRSIGSDADAVADTVQGLLCRNENLTKLRIDDTIIFGLDRLTAVKHSNHSLKELSLIVTEKNCVSGNSSCKSDLRIITNDGIVDLPLPTLSPSLLMEEASRKHLKLELR